MNGTSHGIIAEFDTPEDIVKAARQAWDKGYRRMDAYTPFPVHGLDEVLHFHDWRIPWMIFFGAIMGALAGYGLQYYISVIDYPMLVGGKPAHSWPTYVPVTFELTILFSALTAVFGMLMLNGLPMPYHPVFNAPGFERASSDRFFLCIEATDLLYDVASVQKFLSGFNPLSVNVVSEDPQGVNKKETA